ncbi:hypothetical protein [Magnetococcus sp. PR-3]|uniref:hypothetical protein n=1 Tax=Magnetococcus sp. PR-3 TaxID=3120355 RepID=UPI002FCE222B
MQVVSRLLLSLTLMLGLITTAQAADDHDDYYNIRPIVPLQGEGPEIVEVFNFHCPHCNDFTRYWRSGHTTIRAPAKAK